MLSDIAVWRPGTKYSTAKKVRYLILAKKTQRERERSHVSLKTNKSALTAAKKAGYLILAEKNRQ